MWHVNITEFFNFLVLVSLFLGISAEFSGVVQKTEREIAHKVNFLRNFGETFEKSYTLAAHRGKYSLNSSNNVCNRRRVRNIEPEEKHEHNLECYECDSTSGYKEEKSCYDGNILSTTNCDAAAQCYIDFKPNYIKRGCLVPNKKKQTFYCRCPLCNNKPTNEFSYFNRDVSEWEFDNYRLLTDEISDPFQCITCKTKGLNSTDDDLCRTGVGVGKTVCRSYSACYTNINHETSELTFGSTARPKANKNKSIITSQLDAIIACPYTDIITVFQLRTDKMVMSTVVNAEGPLPL
ncbi:hypothetical protein O0L34_g5590 [Tuta absoluta]|nr:hypothetical protein O0L34_g5590 [Tuta absoluta]